MAITSAIVVFAVLWFLVLFCVLPLRLQSQGEAGDVVPGTPSSAPSDPQMRRRFIITTVVAFAIWAPVCTLIITGVLSVETISWFE